MRRQRALRPFARILGVVAFPAATAFCLSTAHASLGGNEISVAEDAAEWNSVVRESVAEQYVVYEIESSSGSIVREYLTPEGRVFAVTWHGARLPDMRRLLGDYFDIFRTAERLPRARHRPFVIERPDFVVRAGGRLRSFFGEAHVPALVPEGVRVETLP